MSQGLSDPFPSETGRRTVETVSIPSVEGISLPILKTGRNGLVNTSLSVITGPHSGVPEDSKHQTSHPPQGIMDPSKTGRRTGTGQTDPSVFQIFCPKNGRFFDGRSVLRTITFEERLGAPSTGSLCDIGLHPRSKVVIILTYVRCEKPDAGVGPKSRISGTGERDSLEDFETRVRLIWIVVTKRLAFALRSPKSALSSANGIY
ncbi:hypothetical protein DFH08DRAFT_992264 [Mycena albidolilacea]|uniref:Uncharacterized protein n=1 Tax=Mycena albidolilacea TaxID=1033008 RepID=A0AAD6YYD5_9AGAR|nr:hypothetical protein DFH08DRAFT_992264 [Mycena albidolilacea]